MIFKPVPPASPDESIMTHEKAIELITELRNSAPGVLDQDTQDALAMAQAALITEKLNLLR